jgi:hypothetical protein
MDLKDLRREKFERGRLPLFHNKSRAAPSAIVVAPSGLRAVATGAKGFLEPTRESEAAARKDVRGAKDAGTEHAEVEQTRSKSSRRLRELERIEKRSERIVEEASALFETAKPISELDVQEGDAEVNAFQESHLRFLKKGAWRTLRPSARPKRPSRAQRLREL